MRLRKLAPVAALVALACPLSSPAAQGVTNPALTVEPCEVPGIRGAVRCGSLEVWENRDTKTGRKIRIGFLLIPAVGPAPVKDPFVPMAGGPGQAATTMTWAAEAFMPLRQTRDILLVDHRGTGRSHLVQCDRYGPLEDAQAVLDAPFFPAERARACAERQRDSADVRYYTSLDFADDLEELRQALGYTQLNLWGGSYGTRSALTMMRRHPRAVRAAVLEGVAPTDTRHPLHAARIAQDVLEGVFAECAADPACRAAFPDPKGDLERALARFSAGPVRTEVSDPKTGAAIPVRLSRAVFGEGLRYLTYGTAGSSLAPAVIHQAAEGDFAPIAEYTLWARRNVVVGSASDGNGMFLSVSCAEDLAFIDPAEVDPAAAGTYLGTSRVRDQMAACAQWPARNLPRSVTEPVSASIPTLLISGALDPATPAAWGERAARTLSNSRMVLIPSAGHWLSGLEGAEQCVGRMVMEFVAEADPRALDTSCMNGVRRPGFPTERLVMRSPAAMSPAELARYEGKYTGPGGWEVQLRSEGGRLVARSPQGDEWTFVPVEGGRFRILQNPLSFVTFTVENGAVKGYQAKEAGVTYWTMNRVE